MMDPRHGPRSMERSRVGRGNWWPAPVRSRAVKMGAWVLAWVVISGAAMGAANPTTQSTTRPAAVDQRDPGRVVKVAVVQAGTRHSQRGNPGFEANFDRLAELAKQVAKEKPDVIVFPEYAISGWPYPEGESINTLAEEIPGEGRWYKRYVQLAEATQTAVMGWCVERCDGRLYNTSFLLDRGGKFVGKYRKVHANLGEQTWWGWSQGDVLVPIELEGVRYGVSLCSDMWFPETVRCLELAGADVVVHQSIADDMGHLVPARAFDSQVPIVCAIFNGGSYAVDAEGERVGKVSGELGVGRVFEVRPFVVRKGVKYGGQWIPKLGGQNVRNPKAYQILTDPTRRPRWTEVFLDNEGHRQSEEQLRQRFGGRWDANDPGAER